LLTMPLSSAASRYSTHHSRRSAVLQSRQFKEKVCQSVWMRHCSSHQLQHPPLQALSSPAKCNN
jgi:hypothetical protein